MIDGLRIVPDDNILEGTFLRQVRLSKAMAPSMALYEQELSFKGEARSYAKLYQLVDNYLEYSRLAKLRDDKEQLGRRHAAVVQTVGNKSKPKTGECRQFLKTGSCSRDNCPFSHPQDKAGTRKGRPYSGSRKRSESKKKGKGRSKSPDKGKGKGNRGRSSSPKGRKIDVCWSFMIGRCYRGDECWFRHPEPCRQWVQEKGYCKDGQSCRYPHSPLYPDRSKEKATPAVDKNGNAAKAKPKAGSDKGSARNRSKSPSNQGGSQEA
jgi:hypothetical protein